MNQITKLLELRDTLISVEKTIFDQNIANIISDTTEEKIEDIISYMFIDSIQKIPKDQVSIFVKENQSRIIAFETALVNYNQKMSTKLYDLFYSKAYHREDLFYHKNSEGNYILFDEHWFTLEKFKTEVLSYDETHYLVVFTNERPNSIGTSDIQYRTNKMSIPKQAINEFYENHYSLICNKKLSDFVS